MAEALIIDLDGVVRRWAPVDQIEAAFGLPSGALFEVAFEQALLKRAVTGRIDDEEWRATVGDTLGERFGADGAAVVDAWSEPCGEVVPEVLALLRGQRRQRTLALLTNATTRLRADLSRLSLDTEFDIIFNSAELGIAKPDPAVFDTIASQLRIPPSACLFVDDTPGHVAAAEARGFVGHVYTDPEALETFLHRHER